VRIVRLALFVGLVWVCVPGVKAQTNSKNCTTTVSHCVATTAATSAKSEVATFTVTVNTKAQAAPREASAGRPKIARVNGKFMMALEKQHSGTTVEAPMGTLIEVSLPAEMGATEFELSPPGILMPMSAVRHLPKGVIGLLSADNEGTATIHVFGLPNNLTFANATPNWSGYTIGGGPFSSIVGEWTVPTVVSDGDSATWVGIDGVGVNTPLIQTGTEQSDSGGFLGIGAGTTYYAWYELVPSPPVTIPKPVSPGDHIVAFLLAGGDTPPVPNKPSTWWIYMNNETKNWYWTKSVTYTGPLDTAEWIEERPYGCPIDDWFCGYVTLANFGSVTFDGQDYVNGVNPAFSPMDELSIVDGKTTLATPSDPDADLDGFTIAYGADQPGPPGPFVVTTTLPEAYVGIPYSATLQATGELSYQWSGVGLPAWLTLNATTGVLSGTPPTAGTLAFDVQAANAVETNEVSQLQFLALTVGGNPPPPDFAIALAPNPLQLIKTSGACGGSSTVTIVPAFGFSGVVELSLSSSPTFAHLTSTAITPGETSKVVITSSPCHVAVKDTLTVTGKSGGLTHTAMLQVLPPIVLNCNAFVGEGPKPLLCK
jgi:Peptidase A4 family/Putative Ig domain